MPTYNNNTDFLSNLPCNLSLQVLMSKSDRDTLEAKITPLKIKAAICGFPPRKALDPDRLPVDLYKALWWIIYS